MGLALEGLLTTLLRPSVSSEMSVGLGGAVSDALSEGGLEEPPRMRFNSPPWVENRLGFDPASLTDLEEHGWVFVGGER